MADDNAGLLDLLLRQAGGDANLERGLELPAVVLGVAVGRQGHAFEAGDENAVGEGLGYSVREKGRKRGYGEGIRYQVRTSSTHSCKRRSCSSWLKRREWITSGLRTSIMTGFSGELVQQTQSLRGSN